LLSSLGRGPKLFAGAADPAAVADLRKSCAAGDFNFEGQEPAAVADVRTIGFLFARRLCYKVLFVATTLDNATYFFLGA
jgi:hypothetical protein